MGRQACRAELSNLRRGHVVAMGHHTGHHLLAAHRVGDSQHPDIVDAAHRPQDLLDFFRLDLLSRDVDERRCAAGEDQALPGVETAEIARQEPPVRESFIGRRLPGVAGGDRVARDVDSSAIDRPALYVVCRVFEA